MNYLDLIECAEALGEVRASDGAPKAMNRARVLECIRDLREECAEWKERALLAESQLAARNAEAGNP